VDPDVVVTPVGRETELVNSAAAVRTSLRGSSSFGSRSDGFGGRCLGNIFSSSYCSSRRCNRGFISFGSG
ncbi:hypothetical protein PMAYCL1PPCAC_16331, partial [Pristionchus mayeri]